MIEFKRDKVMRAATLDDLLRRIERDVIVAVLKAKGGNVSATARVIGIERTGMYKMLKRHGITMTSGSNR